MLAARRMRQLQKGSDSLIECTNKEAVTALREIAAGKVGLKNPSAIRGLEETLINMQKGSSKRTAAPKSKK